MKYLEWELNPEEKCLSCGERLLYINNTTADNRTVLERYCINCGFQGYVPKKKNLLKEASTSHSHWAAQVKGKTHHCCTICGSKEDVHAHHIIPVSNCEKYDISLIRNVFNGIPLCRKHHEMAHGRWIPHTETRTGLHDVFGG